MPEEHGALLKLYGTTVAIIDKKGLDRSGLTLEEYWREVIHRHAHLFVRQEPGSIVKYRCSSRTTKIEI
jgi:hypothetical protein